VTNRSRTLANGEYIATAIVYDSLTIPPRSEEKTDAVTVALDRRDDYSVVVFFSVRNSRWEC